MELQEQALDMQDNGLPLDYDAALEVGAEALDKEDRALAEMRKILNEPEFNPNAPAQLQKALYITLGNAVTDWTGGGKSGKKQPSTTKEVLVKLADSPFKRALLEYREANSVTKAFFNIETHLDGTRVATPGRSLNIWADGRVHVEWKPFGTITGRFSSSPNMQNVPKWLRSMFKCQPGRKIVAADYDQLELRTLAVLCGDKLLLQKCMTANDKRKLEPDFDPHSFIASHVFKRFIKLALKDPNHNPDPKVKCKCETCHRKNLRDICKRVIYGLNYGAGEATVLEAIYNGGYYGPPISIADIRVVKEIIYKLFPGILVWREKMVREAENTRELRDEDSGRRREFPLGDVPITEIANYPIQATSAAIVNDRCTAFFHISKQLDPTSMYLAQVHDAVYYEVDANCADVFAAAMTKTLTCERAYNGSAPMLFSATAGIADNMRDA
jgi:DNA polymerase-1